MTMSDGRNTSKPEADTSEESGSATDFSTDDSPDFVDVDDVLLGMQYAELAITDDEEGSLKKVSRMNPWHTHGVALITGSVEEAHKPLSTILKDHMNLTCDKIIDVQGMTPGGHFLDTQGYIAHNDDVIVLSFRCTTSMFDWLTNLNTTSSEWEIDEDAAQGYSGMCSGFEGLCCVDEHKPRVHTGFYNNFLASLPDIKQYIEPLLAPDQPPRKLYVVGHSLGAGIATLASCYFLLEHDWLTLPHQMLSLTAGSPRACQKLMREVVHDKLEQCKNNVVFYRMVRDRDIVATVPPAALGFAHVGNLIHIGKDGSVHLNPSNLEEHISDAKEMMELFSFRPESLAEDTERDLLASSTGQSVSTEQEAKDKAKYDKFVKKVPRSFRDHMPDFYLQPLMQIRTIMNARKEAEATEKQAALDAIKKKEAEEAAAAKIVVPVASAPKRKGLFSRMRRKQTTTSEV